MSDEILRVLTIRFTSGSIQKYEFSAQAEEFSVAGRMKEALSENNLIIELDDKTVVIPYQNIETIEISPSPSKLPVTALKNARQVG